MVEAIRRTFGRHTSIQRCQVHKARNIAERLPKHLHASVRAALRQAWELDDADKAERLIRNLARRLEQMAPGVSASIFEGLDEMLTVTRLRLPLTPRRPLACTNIIENMMGTVRRVCRNVKRRRDASMALRWTAAAMREAAKDFWRLKAASSFHCSRPPLPLTKASMRQLRMAVGRRIRSINVVEIWIAAEAVNELAASVLIWRACDGRAALRDGTPRCASRGQVTDHVSLAR